MRLTPVFYSRELIVQDESQEKEHEMPSLCETEDIFAYLSISPTTAQSDAMEVIKNGMESAVKRFCRWRIVQETLTSFLPLHPTAVGYHVPTAETGYGFGAVTSGRNRLQLPAMHVKTITSIYEDSGAKAGFNAEDFPSTTLLTAGDDYFLEKDSGSTYSESGGVIRVGQNWSSVPGTIKVVFVAGFSESELSGEFNGIRYATIRECARAWIARQRENALVSSAGSDALIVSRERLGDYDIAYHNPNSRANQSDYGGYGIPEEFQDFLQSNGYVYCGVSV